MLHGRDFGVLENYPASEYLRIALGCPELEWL
jgi:hypothetical protein